MGNALPNEFKNIKSLEHMPDCYFVKGMLVHVINNLNYVRSIQSLCGGWNDAMAECINQNCLVLKVDDDKAIEIISSSKRKWLFNRAALEPVDLRDYGKMYAGIRQSILEDPVRGETIPSNLRLSKIEGTSGSSSSLQDPLSSVQPSSRPDAVQARLPPLEFKVGDVLRVSSNEKLIQEKQIVCGGYSKMRMRDLIGKLVYVKHFSPKCVKVEKDGRDYDLHPDILDYPKLDLIKDQENVATTNCVAGPDKSSQLFSAIINGDVDKLYENIDIDILNIPNQVGRTPINLACCLGEKEMVEQLVAFGADVNIPDKHGNFPIHNCALNGHVEILIHILAAFPNSLNTTTLYGLSLLDIARQKHNIELENYLLENNIEIANEALPRVKEASLAISLLMPSSSLSALHFDQSGTSSLLEYQPSFSIMKTRQGDNTFHFQHILPEYDTIKVPSTIRPVQENIDTSTTQENECTICYDGLINIAFVKCGHLACKACGDRLVKCHICNAEIEGRMTIYL